MEIDAFLADSVVNAEGKLYVQGAGWNTISTPQVPIRHPRVGIGIIIKVPYTDTNEPHMAEVRLEDADGAELALGEVPPSPDAPDGRLHRLRAQFTLGRPPHLKPGEDQVVALALNIDGLTFGRADSYRFVVAIDGEDTKALPLRILHSAQVGGGS